MEELIPWLYLKGISAGDFSEALTAIVGKDTKGFGRPVIGKPKAKWKDEFEEWRVRDLSSKRYVYCWVDGIYRNVRMDEKQCLLVMMGATPEGTKELIAIEGGCRESGQSWKELPSSLQSGGLSTSPELFIGDGALGFRSALSEVYPESGRQRCRVHKTANIPNKMPKSTQAKARKRIRDRYKGKCNKGL